MPKIHEPDEESDEESDEDCEVYFLKPANEYNIVEKIKEANKELFADSVLEVNDTYSNIDIADGDDSIVQQRKVTFAPNLEIYESDSVVKLRDAQYAGEVRNAKQKQRTAKSKFTVIDEEPFFEQKQRDLEEGCNVTAPPPKSPQSSKYEIYTPAATMPTTKLDDDRDFELEEILVMDMKEMLPPARRMQNTFDYADELYTAVNSVVEEEDNKSLTNLFSFEVEDDEEAQKQALEEALNYRLADEEEKIDEDDDQLSLIVASYLSSKYDHGCGGVISTSPETSSNTTTNTGKAITKPRCAKFSKRFSLRRKAINETYTTGVYSNGLKQLSAPGVPQKEMTDLKLNYKICCEYRHAAPQKLPKYTGYLSEYGLSRKQFAQKEEEIQRRQRFLLQQALRTNEQQMHKLQDNHRAFISWLRNKIRFPINKTRNMYDVKANSSSRIGCSSTSGGENCGATAKKRCAYGGKNMK